MFSFTLPFLAVLGVLPCVLSLPIFLRCTLAEMQLKEEEVSSTQDKKGSALPSLLQGYIKESRRLYIGAPTRHIGCPRMGWRWDLVSLPSDPL